MKLSPEELNDNVKILIRDAFCNSTEENHTNDPFDYTAVVVSGKVKRS